MSVTWTCTNCVCMSCHLFQVQTVRDFSVQGFEAKLSLRIGSPHCRSLLVSEERERPFGTYLFHSHHSISSPHIPTLVSTTSHSTTCSQAWVQFFKWLRILPSIFRCLSFTLNYPAPTQGNLIDSRHHPKIANSIATGGPRGFSQRLIQVAAPCISHSYLCCRWLCSRSPH